jgi:hypothetical protein
MRDAERILEENTRSSTSLVRFNVLFAREGKVYFTKLEWVFWSMKKGSPARPAIVESH